MQREKGRKGERKRGREEGRKEERKGGRKGGGGGGKEFSPFNNEKNPIEEWAKTISTRIHKQSISTWKDTKHHSPCRNADYRHNEMPLHTHSAGHNRERRSKQWKAVKSCNPPALPVRMLNGTATVEGKHLLKKLNLGCSAGPSCALRVIANSRDSKGYLIALFSTATRWKQHKCLAINEYIKQILTHT